MKFFLDNCLPPSWADALNALIQRDGDEIIHLRKLFNPSMPDIDWITQLAQRDDGPFIIISGDDRITRNPHERAAWKASKLTAFFLAGGWGQQPMWDKTWMFIRWWPRIRAVAANVQQGAGFVVPVVFGANKLKSI